MNTILPSFIKSFETNGSLNILYLELYIACYFLHQTNILIKYREKHPNTLHQKNTTPSNLCALAFSRHSINICWKRNSWNNTFWMWFGAAFSYFKKESWTMYLLGIHMNLKYKMALHDLNTADETLKCYMVFCSCLQVSSVLLISYLSIQIPTELLLTLSEACTCSEKWQEN